MKILLVALILFISVTGCSNDTSHNVIARNDVSFGMTMDEVKQIETEGKLLEETTVKLFYTDIEYAGFPVLLEYHFTDGLLAEVSYNFDEEDISEDNYRQIKFGTLIEKYGEPTDYLYQNSDSRGNPHFDASWKLAEVTVNMSLRTFPWDENPSMYVYIVPNN